MNEWTQTGKLILAPIMAIAAPLFAQASGAIKDESFPWAQLVSPVASSAMLAWYLWYDVSKARPKRDKLHMEERRELRADMAAERSRYEKVLSEQEQRHERKINADDEQRKAERAEFLEALRSIQCQYKGI